MDPDKNPRFVSSSIDRLIGLVVKASASRAEDPRRHGDSKSKAMYVKGKYICFAGCCIHTCCDQKCIGTHSARDWHSFKYKHTDTFHTEQIYQKYFIGIQKMYTTQPML